MTFAELKAELASRGFDYLSASRRGQYINWARAELDDMFPWPYLEASSSGTAPLAITDLREVDSVTDTSTEIPLLRHSPGEILDTFGSLTLTGSPAWWYTTTGSTVAVFPVSSDTISVRYWKVSPDLSGETDVPLAPSRWHRLIVDIAVRMAYRDSDNHQAATALQAQIDRDLGLMVNVLLVDSGPAEIAPVGGDC